VTARLKSSSLGPELAVQEDDQLEPPELESIDLAAKDGGQLSLIEPEWK
jgi:hypothetical protein